MDRPRVFRLVRIALSAVCLTACLLLIALWARSYHSSDRLLGPLPRSHMFQAYTWQGTFHLIVSGPAYRLDVWEFYSSPVPEPSSDANATRQVPRFLGFSFRETQGIVHSTAPAWFLLALLVAVPTALWFDRLRWHFSLRTLLIATTLVALMLGIVAGFAR